MFPTKVPHLSIIFPWEMVKMIPKIWNEIQNILLCLSCVLAGDRADRPYGPELNS